MALKSKPQLKCCKDSQSYEGTLANVQSIQEKTQTQGETQVSTK